MSVGHVSEGADAKSDRAAVARNTRHALVALLALGLLTGTASARDAGASEDAGAPTAGATDAALPPPPAPPSGPAGAARFDIATLLDPGRLNSGGDDFADAKLGEGGQNPPLFFCEEVRDQEHDSELKKDVDLPSSSIAFQLIKKLDEEARSRKGSNGKRLEALAQIRKLMESYLGPDKDPAKIPGDLKGRYNNLKFIVDSNEPLSHDLHARWSAIKKRTEALRKDVKEAVGKERKAGLALKRCAILLEKVDEQITENTPLKSKTPQRDYVSYQAHVPRRFSFEDEGYKCEKGEGPSPTTSVPVEHLRFLIRMAKGHYEAALKRDEAYRQAAFRASKLGRDKKELIHALGRITKGRDHNNNLLELWPKIIAQAEVLERLIIAADRTETDGASKIHRCEKK